MTREQVSTLKWQQLNLIYMAVRNERMELIGDFNRNDIDKAYYQPEYDWSFVILKDGSKHYRVGDDWFDDYEQFLEALKDV